MFYQIHRYEPILIACRLSKTSEPTAMSILSGGPLDTSGSGLADTSGTMASLLTPSSRIRSRGFGDYRIVGAVPMSMSLIRDISSRPWLYYLQIWTTQYEYGTSVSQCRHKYMLYNLTSYIVLMLWFIDRERSLNAIDKHPRASS